MKKDCRLPTTVKTHLPESPFGVLVMLLFFRDPRLSCGPVTANVQGVGRREVARIPSTHARTHARTHTHHTRSTHVYKDAAI